MAGDELNRSRSFTLATTSARLSDEQFGSQAERIFFSIINTSTGGETVSLAFGEEAASGSGIVLSPGGSYSESADGINKCTQQTINALGSAATATIAFSERIMNRRF